MDQSTHLQIAARIHFALRRQYGEDIEIGALLKNEGEAREALWVCEASDDSELIGLARQFRACSQALAKLAQPPEPPKTTTLPLTRRDGPIKEAPWASSTSGFGTTRAAGFAPLAEAATSERRLVGSNWFKRSAHA